jgi:4-amino-4-deoxy-L-arabinose transferase-like glycosyltransferase
MEVDAAQYADMSREMLARGEFLQVFDLGRDYLDKPPFLFWINSASMYLFGVSHFAFKFPSLLFALFAVFSTYKLAALLYNQSVAVISAIVLASSQCLFLITNDVRTDTILMSWVIFSLWQLIKWVHSQKLINLIIGFAAIGCGMLTKGPIALIVPVFALGTHFIVKKKFSMFLRWEYLAGLVVIAIILLPMCIGLYQQFDLHPEKLVNGKHNVSGLRFFFWTQSFGRITGESVWDNNAGFFYLIQNMLWSFLPWIFFFLYALVIRAKKIFNRRTKTNNEAEFYTVGGFLLTYISLALSNYQLPHYIFVVFPLAAIITGDSLNTMMREGPYQKTKLFFFNFHSIFFVLVWVCVIVFTWLVFDTIPLYGKLLSAFGFAGYLFLVFKIRTRVNGVLIICLYTIIGANFFLSTFFYPALLKYQMGGEVGRYVNLHRLPVDSLYILGSNERHALSFYCQRTIPEINDVAELKEGYYVITGEEGLLEINKTGRVYKVLINGSRYAVSSLTFKFLNTKSREKSLIKYYLILLE